jgi:hypothetical protein
MRERAEDAKEQTRPTDVRGEAEVMVKTMNLRPWLRVRRLAMKVRM